MKPLFSILLAGIMTSALLAQPSNDNPCEAIPLIADTACKIMDMSNFGATNTWAVPATPCASSGKDVWFSAVIPSSGMLTVETFAGTITDGVLGIYTGTCDSLSYAYCNDNYGIDPMPRIDLKGFIPGDTIYIRFFRKGGGTGTFSICVWNNSPALALNNDCFSAQLLCTNADFYSLSSGPGTYDDLNDINSGCIENGEYASSWYVFTIGHPGELSITINPIGASYNYNFAIWGTAPACPPTGPPIRCSYANTTGSTGIHLGSVDEEEGTEGDGWVKFIDVDVGQTYLLMIDDNNGDAKGFHVIFSGPPTISCAPFTLPVAISTFTGYADGMLNVLEWTAASQLNNAEFIIERAAGDTMFTKIGSIAGAGTTSISTDYLFYDEMPPSGITYYRLTLVATDGSRTYTPIVAVARTGSNAVMVYPNPSTGTIQITCPAIPYRKYSIQVANMFGQNIQVDDVMTNGEQLVAELHIPTPGIFNIIINDGSRYESTSVVILE